NTRGRRATRAREVQPRYASPIYKTSRVYISAIDCKMTGGYHVYAGGLGCNFARGFRCEPRFWHEQALFLPPHYISVVLYDGFVNSAMGKGITNPLRISTRTRGGLKVGDRAFDGRSVEMIEITES